MQKRSRETSSSEPDYFQLRNTAGGYSEGSSCGHDQVGWCYKASSWTIEGGDWGGGGLPASTSDTQDTDPVREVLLQFHES